MVNNERRLLDVEPLELEFPFELRKQISSSIQLTNKSDDYIAYKIKTTNPKRYSVRPSNGVILPHALANVVVTLQPQREAPPDMQCKDKFLVQSVIVNSVATVKDIMQEMFEKESGNKIDEVKLRVVYVLPPRPPSPVPEEAEEELSSPVVINSNDRTVDTKAPIIATKENALLPNESSEDEIRRLIEERNMAVRQSNELQRELEAARRNIPKRPAGFSAVLVLLFALLGVLLGYFIMI